MRRRASEHVSAREERARAVRSRRSIPSELLESAGLVMIETDRAQGAVAARCRRSRSSSAGRAASARRLQESDDAGAGRDRT